MEKKIKNLQYWSVVLLSMLTMLAISQTSQAYVISWNFYDFNTLNPIAGLNVSMSENITENSRLTDSAGYAQMNLPSNFSGIYSMKTLKTGYTEYSKTYNLTGNLSEEIYVYPFSHQGIIRVKIVDLTLGEHSSCFFYDNSRFLGCYGLNGSDTVQLHTNMNYTWTPIIQKTDIISSPSNIGRYAWTFSGIIIGVLAFLTVVGLLTFIFVRMAKK